MTTPALHDLLAEQQQHLTELQRIQALELKALEERNAPALEEFTQNKGILLSAIEVLDQQLSQHPDREQLTSDPELVSLRAEINSLVALVREQNEVNGQVIRLTLGRIQTLKSELQKLHGNDAGTYDEKGRTQGGLGGKSIKA